VPPPATAIKPEEVAAKSSEVANFVISFSEKFAVSPEIEKIQQSFPQISKRIDLDAAETTATVGAQPSSAFLEAQAHTSVLKNPPPQGLFVGYGDSSINFELRAWTDRFDKWVLIRSELASAVYDAVIAVGMAFPFPQRKVRILGDETAQKVASPRSGGGAETTQEK